MRLLLTLLCLLMVPITAPNDTLTVGKWKLKRKIPKAGPNRCFVDTVSFYENNEFELVFKTIISNEVEVYTYKGKFDEKGTSTLALGDEVAYLKDFKRTESTVDFRFEYGEKLGMFCTREKHPYPHKHLPHQIIGNRISDRAEK